MPIKYLSKKVNGGQRLGDRVASGKITLNAILKKEGLRVRAEFSWFSMGPAAGSCKHDNEHPRCIKGGKFD
jgi:hypothetical protein